MDQIIRDPERIRRKCKGRHYELASRVRCGLCGSAMVGQTLTTKGKPYTYYRCRHAYDKNSGGDCPARYVQARGLEDAVWAEVRRVLSSPALVLDELRRVRSEEPAQEDIASLRRELKDLERQERRIVELYVDGGYSEEVLDGRQATLNQRRSVLEDRLRAAKRLDLDFIENIDPERLDAVCAAILDWLDEADDAQRAQVLEALQIKVEATREQVTISGIIPSDAPEFITIEQTSA